MRKKNVPTEHFKGTMKIEIIKNYWDMEIIGNRRKKNISIEFVLDRKSISIKTKKLEIDFKFTATDLSNFDKR